MQNKDRDMEDIANFCQKFKLYCDEVRNQAGQLGQIAVVAGDSLRDEVGKNATLQILKFSKELMQIVEQAEQPLLDLEMRNRRMMEDMERLKGRIR